MQHPPQGHTPESDVFTFEQIFQILGFRDAATVNTLIRDGWLVSAPGRRNCIMRYSVLALLEVLLVQAESPIRPEDWVEDRLESDEPLMTPLQAAWRLAISVAEIEQLMLEGKVLFIPEPMGKGRFISPESSVFDDHPPKVFSPADDVPLTVHEQAVILGEDPDVVRRWRGKGLTCFSHAHRKPSIMFLSCMVEFLRKVGVGVDASDWVRKASAGELVVFTEEEAMLRTGLTSRDLQEAAASGRVPMIEYPKGRRVYQADAVMEEAERR